MSGESMREAAKAAARRTATLRTQQRECAEPVEASVDVSVWMSAAAIAMVVATVARVIVSV